VLILPIGRKIYKFVGICQENTRGEIKNYPKAVFYFGQMDIVSVARIPLKTEECLLTQHLNDIY